MTSLLSEMGRAVQDRNRKLAERFLCECFVTCQGVLCQGTGSYNAKIGDRLVIEIENGAHGPCLVLRLPPTDVVVGRVAKGEAEVLLPLFCDPIFMLGDW